MKLLMYTKPIKKVPPLHLHIAYLSGFKRGGGRGNINLLRVVLSPWLNL
jgi:hypothetical protein